MSRGERGPLEVHVEEILKSNGSAFGAYKNRLMKVYEISKDNEISLLSFDQKDSAIRFHFGNENLGFGKLYFIFEVGLINPKIRWRHLLRSRESLTPIVLTQPVSFLPAFSYSLDRTLTIINWGNRQFVLNPQILEKMDLKSVACIVENCTDCEISAANLLWPKRVDRILQNSALTELTRDWIVNSLLPPKIGNKWDPWDESPFVIIGDTSIEILTVHKALTCIDQSTISQPDSYGMLTAKAWILDRGLRVREITCHFSDEYHSDLLEESVHEVILVKRLTVSKNKPGSSQIIFYPFASSPLFNREVPGQILTATSIVLRSLYLWNSESPFEVSKSQARKLVTDIFRNIAFSKYDRTELGLSLLENDEGLCLLAKSLGVYSCNENISFIHPAIVEIVSLIYQSFDVSFDRESLELLNSAITKVNLGESSRVNSTFKVQELVQNTLGKRLDFGQASLVKAALIQFNKSLVATSKKI
jgi:hypothetical protein